MADYSSSLIPTFPGINDAPTEPTASSAGNGSHVIAKHNQLAASVEADVNSLESELANLGGSTPSAPQGEPPLVISVNGKVGAVRLTARDIPGIPEPAAPSGAVPSAAPFKIVRLEVDGYYSFTDAQATHLILKPQQTNNTFVLDFTPVHNTLWIKNETLATRSIEVLDASANPVGFIKQKEVVLLVLEEGTWRDFGISKAFFPY